MTAKKVVHVSGKRKKAIARATITNGKGQIRINKRLLQLYNPRLARMRIMEPLLIAGDDVMNRVKIEVDVRGGGWNGQAEAARLAIARGLVQFTGNKQLEKEFLNYDRHLLVADIRRREARKPNTHSKARAKVQKSYR
ncbi:MAG: 30S ribosomal protein S9 [Nanoarchaeota archaeon]